MRILDRSTLRDVAFSHEQTGYGVLVIITVIVEPNSDDTFDISDYDNVSEDAIECFLTSIHADIEQKIRTYALPFKRAWSRKYNIQASCDQKFNLVLV